MACHLSWLNFGSLGANANKTPQNSANCNLRVSIKVRARHRSGAESVSSAVWIQYNKKKMGATSFLSFLEPVQTSGNFWNLNYNNLKKSCNFTIEFLLTLVWKLNIFRKMVFRNDPDGWSAVRILRSKVRIFCADQ